MLTTTTTTLTTTCGRWASSYSASSSSTSVGGGGGSRGRTTTVAVRAGCAASGKQRQQVVVEVSSVRGVCRGRRRNAVYGVGGGARRAGVIPAAAESPSSSPSPSSVPWYVNVPLTLAYAALTYSALCNAFMWSLDFVDPIIPSPLGSLIGKLAVALGASTLAALNFYPQAKRQLGRCARVFADAASSEQLKADAAKFGVLVVMKMGFEFIAYWKALTSFTPCTASLELAGYYGVAFVGHAAFMGAASKVIGADGQTEVVPEPVRKLIGGFDLVLALLCFATSKLALAGVSALSGVCGFTFFILALYFTFEDKIKAAKQRRENDDDAVATA